MKKSLHLKSLEEQLAQPDIWNNQEKAQALNKEATQIRDLIKQWETMNTKVNDSAGLVDMGEEENDEAIISEVSKDLYVVEREVGQLEFRRMLSGESDRFGAILNINAGAGGTDAQDWASMLLRMYVRWIERKGYQCEVVDYQDGEEAGIKSATVMVTGDYAYINYQRLYTIPQSEIIDLKINGVSNKNIDQRIFKTKEGQQFTEFGFLVPVLAQKETQVEIYLKNPLSLASKKKLFIQKQAGLPKTHYLVTYQEQSKDFELTSDQNLVFD